jgi:Bacterial EndoU nuclease
MNKTTKQIILLVVALTFLGVSFYINSNNQEEPDVPDIQETSNNSSTNFVSPKKSPISETVFKHIFEGNINRRGEAVGFHHNPSSTNKDTGIVKVIKPENNCGVYTAQVKIQGKTKKAYSTMFPDKLKKSEIVSILESSYKKGISANPNKSIFTVVTDNCFRITMILNNNQLATAYPLY